MSMAADSGRVPSRNTTSESVYITGMFLALGGILMFFAALVSAWVVRKGLSASAIEGPLGLPLRLLAVNTVLIVASSATLGLAQRALRIGDLGRFRLCWNATLVLGVVFLIGQIAAWRQMIVAGAALTGSDVSFFYLFTASHALHLFGGLVGLGVVGTCRTRRMAHRVAVRVMAMYWHFLTAVWCAIFALIFWGMSR